MFAVILRRMREAVRERRCVFTLHADDKMDMHQLARRDVERCILTGEILERQKDYEAGEWKYRIRGESASGYPLLEVVAKLGLTGQLVIITVYAVNEEDEL